MAYLGPGGAGHFVKMVHNGIEYAFMQLLAEPTICSAGPGAQGRGIARGYREWIAAELDSFLVEITVNILGEVDPKTGKPLIDQILDEAGQKGTGRWASEDAMELQVPMPTIDAAVAMRNLSMYKEERVAFIAPSIFRWEICGRTGRFLDKLSRALYAAWSSRSTRGCRCSDPPPALSSTASRFKRSRGSGAAGAYPGRGPREDPRRARAGTGASELLPDPALGRVWPGAGRSARGGLRAARLGIPAPGLMASLAYLDFFRSPKPCRPTSSRPSAIISAPTPTNASTKKASFTPIGSDPEG